MPVGVVLVMAMVAAQGRLGKMAIHVSVSLDQMIFLTLATSVKDLQGKLVE
jgi:hypothetical protein